MNKYFRRILCVAMTATILLSDSIHTNAADVLIGTEIDADFETNDTDTEPEVTLTKVTAKPTTKLAKLQTVGTGTYKVNVKKLMDDQRISTLRQVQFKAPKAGTYRFKVTNPQSADLSYPIFSFQLKSATDKTSRVIKLTTGAGTFQKIMVYNKNYEDAYYNYLMGYKEDSGQEVDEDECWETMIADMEERVSGGVCASFFVDLELKKDDTILVCSNSVGEYSYKGNIYQVKDAYNYELTIKKV